MSQIQGAGGQPQKQGKYAALYTGRVFNGLYTNRSPLRGSLPSLYESFYKVSYGDVMIAGSNVEVSNRLTLVRRPGNTIFDTNTYTNVQSFFEFPVTKSASDAFGTTLEEIFTMISTQGALYATQNGVKQLVFDDPAVAGQYYMQAVGNELYFANGVDNKKWLQSLIVWAQSFEFQGTAGTSGTYPFFSTYMITGPASPGVTSPTSNTQVIQQFIGIAAANITAVQVADGVLTLTISTVDIPTNAANASFPLNTAGIGASFQLWGLNTATWLNGVVITALQAVTIGTTTTITANTSTFALPAADTTYGPTADTGFLQQIGSTPVVAETGTIEPTWGTFANYVPNTSSSWGATVPVGNVLLDGNVLWVNRGTDVENWGIAAPTTAVTTTETNSTFSSWQANTYYSISGFIINGGNLYKITAPGTTGATFGSGTATFSLITSLAAATWAPHTLYNDGGYVGSYPWAHGTQVINGVTYSVGAFIPNNYDSPGDSVVIATAGGVPCVFLAQRNISQGNSTPINVPISATFGGGTPGDIGWSAAFFDHCGYLDFSTGGMVDLKYGGSVGNPENYVTGLPVTPTATATGLSSLMWNYYANGPNEVAPMQLDTVNSAGEMAQGAYTVPWPGSPHDVFQFLQWGKIRIPVPGMLVTFSVTPSDAFWLGIESAAGATFISGTSPTYEGLPTTVAPGNPSFGGRTVTPWNGYPILGGWNSANNGQTMQLVISFPTAGVFGMEIAYAKNSGGGSFDHVILTVIANSSLIVPEAADAQPWFESCATSPAFGGTGFSTAPAAQNSYPIAPELTNNLPGNVYQVGTIQGTELIWENLGPVSAFAWQPNINVSLPETTVIELGDEFFPYEPGVTSTTAPAWNTTLLSITPDVQPLNWINEGAIPPITPASGAILATSTQGWQYWIALVNTLDDTVSNLSPASLGTGPVDGNILIPPGSGIDLTTLDPQVDYVAIFRSLDGFAEPFLIPGQGNSIWTVPLTTYLQDGYVDTTPDTALNEFITGALAGENTPPLPGTINLTYHLGRIFYSIGSTVYYTSGPTATSGNGDGTNPINFDVLPSLVVRLVPTAIGLLVFTLSDIYIIAGSGTASSPILPAIPYEQGVGLSNYNGLDINGTLIGFFTTDKQFLIFDPSAGLSYAGNPIGDQFRLNNGNPGQSWNTATVYVAWYTFGEDQGWFVGDGKFGWYKLIATPSPETGICWSPFATIAGGAGVGAIASIQTSPGVHNLLLGPFGSGNILARNVDATTDNGTTGANGTSYPAYGVFGSYVLALPGQVAKVAYITTDSVNTGSPLVIGLLVDEALPYYKGSFEILKDWVFDPPCLKPSKSILSQRFYLSELHEEAVCRHLQLMVQWPAENAANELMAFSLWGAYEIEN